MDNLCYICGCDEVTKEDESKENDWVKCYSCFRWFHSLCALYPGGIAADYMIGTVRHPKQKDSTSCVLYVMKFAEHFLEGHSNHQSFKINVKAIENIRK